ncbi:glycosyl hydrolase [Novosphingobium aquae]|uniref:Glycosyl hydrolase n=1 Tax=Novosphingobium aquae TaxID=3133435 RepID=A0ABU8S7N4_9SPHN
MKAFGSTGSLRAALLLATALVPASAVAQTAAPAAAPAQPSLEDQFVNPPQSARPRVWWHWMNGNITKDGIAKDLAWMKRVGIGGMQNFDANLQTPQVVDKRLVYMDEGWKDAFRFTANEAERHGLELAIAASPGWSETGGPWVKPEDGLKKVVWSETLVEGGRPFKGRIAAPVNVTGPFQGMGPAMSIEELMGGSGAKKVKPKHFADIAVLAFPVTEPAALAVPTVTTLDGKPLSMAPMVDGDLASATDIGTIGQSDAGLLVTYAAPQTVRAATIMIPGASVAFLGSLVEPRLEASDDGKAWRKIADLSVQPVPTTVSFAPVTARYFRVMMPPKSFNINALGASAEGADAGLYGSALGGGGPRMPLRVADFRLQADPRIDRYEAKAGFELERDYYKLSTDVADAAGVAPSSVIDLTSRLKADGSLDWTPPKGKWKVLRLGSTLLGTTNHPAPPEATGLEVDKFDGPSVRRYLDHYIGMYKDASGGMLGDKGVRAILTDSIEVGAANWTPKMVDQFKRLRGYDPTPWLPTLTGTIIGSRAESDKFLYDYRRTLADLMASEHYGTVAKVAHENGLKVYGEALEDKRPSLGDDMEMRRYADVPMAAFWTFPRGGALRDTLIADMKGAASVAHVFGQNIVAAESLTAAMNPWNYAPNDLKRMIDIEFVTGVNRPVIHTSVHQPMDSKFPGLSLFIFGQYFNRHESWAEMAKPWVDYMARNSAMLQAGRNFADVAYFYGEEAPLTSLYGDGPVKDAPRTYAYDFVNYGALTDALSNDGAEIVSTGGARYKALYLGGSTHRMTLSALKRLAALVEGGATIVGMKPESSPSLSDNSAEWSALAGKLWAGGDVTKLGKGQVIASRNIEAALAGAGITSDFRHDGGADVRVEFVHRRLAGGDSYFLVNRNNVPANVEARFRVTGKAPELWDAETGKSEPLSYRIEGGETVVPLQFGAEKSFHVVFRKPAPTASLAIKKVVPVELATIAGAWDVAFQPGRGAPSGAKLAALEGLEKNADSGIKYFSGMATYSRDFTTPKGWKPGQPLWLDLGDVRELAEVSINSKPAGAAWHPPYRVEIGSAVKKGKNRLEVKVANLWVNRLIGDRQPGATKLTWTAMPTYKPDAPLRPSGLIGPVKLLGQGK